MANSGGGVDEKNLELIVGAGGWVNPGDIARRMRRRGMNKTEFVPLIRELAELGAKINERHKPQISDKRLILSVNG